MNIVRDRWFCSRSILTSILFLSLVTAFLAPAKILRAQLNEIPSQSGDVRSLLNQANEIFDALEKRESKEPDADMVAEAQRLIDRVDRLEPGSTWLEYLTGRMNAVTGRPGDAIDRLRRFVTTPQGRTDWVSYRVLGDLFISEFPRLARSNYAKASELNSGEPSVTFGLSRCAARLGDKEEAIRLARQAVDRSTEPDVRYLSNLALLHSAEGDWDEALRAGEPALAVAKENLDANPGDRALLQATERQHRVLLSILESQLKAEGAHPERAYLRMAQVVRDQAEVNWRLSFHTEVSVLERALEDEGVEPSADLLERYGNALVMIGRSSDAIEAFEKLLAIQPDHAGATKWIGRLRNSGGAVEAAPPSP